MSDPMNHDLLKAVAEENTKDQQKKTGEETYTPRPKFHVILAWVLLVLVLIGVGLYYYYIATA